MTADDNDSFAFILLYYATFILYGATTLDPKKTTTEFIFSFNNNKIKSKFVSVIADFSISKVSELK